MLPTETKILWAKSGITHLHKVAISLTCDCFFSVITLFILRHCLCARRPSRIISVRQVSNWAHFDLYNRVGWAVPAIWPRYYSRPFIRIFKRRGSAGVVWTECLRKAVGIWPPALIPGHDRGQLRQTNKALPSAFDIGTEWKPRNFILAMLTWTSPWTLMSLPVQFEFRQLLHMPRREERTVSIRPASRLSSPPQRTMALCEKCWAFSLKKFY